MLRPSRVDDRKPIKVNQAAAAAPKLRKIYISKWLQIMIQRTSIEWTIIKE
jgi:hypothetical protein